MRHRVALADDIVEVDRYKGAHDRLVVAEVEFADVHGAVGFEPPAWFGAEVTDDPRFKNKGARALASALPTS